MPASSDHDELYRGTVDEIAPRLLGGVLRHGEVAVRLTEVEAYGAADDPASHAHRGRTRRNASMFGPAAYLYCYFTYGMHTCANIVVTPEGEAGAVLLRAGEVIAGLETARARRLPGRDRDLARGPARLCQALAITLDLDGSSLEDGPVRFQPPAAQPAEPVASGPRVGVRGAADRPWRYWIEGDPTVSSYRSAAPPRAR